MTIKKSVFLQILELFKPVTSKMTSKCKMLLADNSEITADRTPVSVSCLDPKRPSRPRPHGQNTWRQCLSGKLQDSVSWHQAKPRGHIPVRHRDPGSGGEWPAPCPALRARHSQMEAPDCAPGKPSLNKLQENCEHHLAP